MCVCACVCVCVCVRVFVCVWGLSKSGISNPFGIGAGSLPVVQLTPHRGSLLPLWQYGAERSVHQTAGAPPPPPHLVPWPSCGPGIIPHIFRRGQSPEQTAQALTAKGYCHTMQRDRLVEGENTVVSSQNIWIYIYIYIYIYTHTHTHTIWNIWILLVWGQTHTSPTMSFLWLSAFPGFYLLLMSLVLHPSHVSSLSLSLSLALSLSLSLYSLYFLLSIRYEELKAESWTCDSRLWTQRTRCVMGSSVSRSPGAPALMDHEVKNRPHVPDNATQGWLVCIAQAWPSLWPATQTKGSRSSHTLSSPCL